MAGVVHVLQPTAHLACSMRSPLVYVPPCAHARRCNGVKRCRPFATSLTAQKLQRRCLTVRAAADAQVDTKEHLQLATAKLPRGMNMLGFTDSLYQWAATLTSSGQNMPFALPIKADKLKNGFQMSLLRIKDGRPMSVGDIVASVEEVDDQGDVLFVRFFEGPASGIDRQGPPIKDPRQRVQTNAEALIDIPIIMETMKQAIRKAVVQNRS